MTTPETERENERKGTKMNNNNRMIEKLLASKRSENAQKKSGYPTQPGNRSTAPRQSPRKRKYQAIIYQIARIVKRIKWKRIAVLFLAIFGIFRLVSCAIDSGMEDDAETVPPETVITEEQAQQTTQIIEYIFRDSSTVDNQSKKRYDLTAAERWEVASVVTAEAGGEPIEGMMAVAQCILQACEDDGIRPCEAVTKYKYAKNRPDPTEEALEAVQAVFDFGQVASTEPIKYFYAPARCQSDWHESQVYVMTINGHKFFKEAE